MKSKIIVFACTGICWFLIFSLPISGQKVFSWVTDGLAFTFGKASVFLNAEAPHRSLTDGVESSSHQELPEGRKSNIDRKRVLDALSAPFGAPPSN